MSLSAVQTARQSLTPLQKQMVAQLLKCEQQFLDPWSSASEPLTGFEGVVEADRLLCSRQARGLLIGGCAKAIYQGHGWDRIAQHKDVDVLVLDGSFALETPFEGGIDWWLPETRRIDTHSFLGTVTGYVNGNGVVLCFGARINPRARPGLYLAPSEFYKSAITLQATKFVNWDGVTFDADALDEYHERLDAQFSGYAAKRVHKWFVDPHERRLRLRSRDRLHQDDPPDGEIELIELIKAARDGLRSAHGKTPASK